MLLPSPAALGNVPKRIVSLVPSQTELLFSLGLQDEVVGITRFCVRPDKWFHSKTRIGGTKTIQPNVIDRLEPQLVIANKEENIKEQVELLAAKYPVWLTDVNNLEDALQMIADLGQLTGKALKAQNIIRKIRVGFEDLLAQVATANYHPRTAYLIWRKPYMSVGADTFIDSMLTRCGFDNIFISQRRYPEIEVSQIADANCQLLLLSSEPYPFRQKHVDELQARLPSVKIILVDGEIFSWYGSRLLEAPTYFKKLIEQCLS